MKTVEKRELSDLVAPIDGGGGFRLIDAIFFSNGL